MESERCQFFLKKILPHVSHFSGLNMAASASAGGNISAGSTASDLFVTFLDPQTLQDDDSKPFTAFQIEVKNGKVCN